MAEIKRIIALLLSFFQLLFSGVSYGEIISVENQPEAIEVVNNIDGDTPLSDSVKLAAAVRNQISVGFTDKDRSATLIKNENAQVLHGLTENKNATLMNSQGEIYIENSFDAFYTDGKGTHYAEKSRTDGRVNTIRLGEYYYDTHIRDFDFTTSSLQKKKFGLDKCFHIFGDRMYLQYSVLAEEATTALESFGAEIKVPVNTVEKMMIQDGNGTYDSVTGFDENTVSAVAFDIKNTGVAGIIIPSDGSTAKVTVTVEKKNYVVRVYSSYVSGTGINKYDETGGYDLNSVTFGFRVYNDDTHAFDGMLKETYLERNPLKGVSCNLKNVNGSYLGYEALRGTYAFKMDGTDFNTAYKNPEWQLAMGLEFNGDSRDRDIFVRINGSNGCLEAAALLDENGLLSAEEVQVCKNFQGDGGEDFYSAKDYQYGDSFFPIHIEANEKIKLTVLNLYQNWGNYPLKQISSIEFHVSYYHLSTGVTESNCIAPYFVFQKDGWTLPDFRNASGNLWSSQPQHNSVGILRFMTYRKGTVSKENIYSELTNSTVNSTGLCYSDVINDYVSDCGSYTYSLRHIEMPQTDENRTYYTLKVNFNRDVTFSDFKEDFDLFNFYGRFVDFKQMDYLDENNESKTVAVTPKGEDYYTLGSESPYFGLFDVTDETEYQLANCFGCNFALLIKDSKMVIGGETSNIPFCVRKSTENSQVSVALTLDSEKLAFKAGDSIEINLILLPWGVGDETVDKNVLTVREDSLLKPVTLNATVGTVVDDGFLPTVKAQNNEAQFKLKGGRNNIAVKITNLTEPKLPTVYVNGEKYELASKNGYDGYSIRYEDDGTYSASFIINQTAPDDVVSVSIGD